MSVDKVIAKFIRLTFLAHPVNYICLSRCSAGGTAWIYATAS